MVLRDVGWDKKELLESNLHVYDGDIAWESGLKEGIRKNQEIFIRVR